jgi:hypothetical protein
MVTVDEKKQLETHNLRSDHYLKTFRTIWGFTNQKNACNTLRTMPKSITAPDHQLSHFAKCFILKVNVNLLEVKMNVLYKNRLQEITG